MTNGSNAPPGRAPGAVAREAPVTHGLVLGKFLPYHDGHAHLIRAARRQVDRLTVLACSVRREPIPGGVRSQWVRAAHPDCRVVHVNDEVPQAPEDDPDFWPIWTALIGRYAGPVTHVFTSEAYGDELARRLGARHVCVDRERRAVPVSGTAVRANPIAHWDFLPEVVRPYFARRVALVGAESVGKTTLARSLADHFATAWVPEYARAFCEARDAAALGLDDLAAIAWGQAVWEDDAARRANRVLICDTELHTTCTWSDLLVGARPPWLTRAARARRYDLVLHLAPDVPWVDDGTRVLADRRAEHDRRLGAELAAAGRNVQVIRGPFDRRLEAAREAVAALLAGGPAGGA